MRLGGEKIVHLGGGSSAVFRGTSRKIKKERPNGQLEEGNKSPCHPGRGHSPFGILRRGNTSRFIGSWGGKKKRRLLCEEEGKGYSEPGR